LLPLSPPSAALCPVLSKHSPLSDTRKKEKEKAKAKAKKKVRDKQSAKLFQGI
jgi:hypothetical protein